MSDEHSFLAALAAHPGDDTTRLVYADWLDEHGQPAKAEYLRLVAELVPHYQTGGADPPQTARVLALAETLPQDWRLAAAARFTAVLYGVEPAEKINAIKLVRELTGEGLREAKNFVEALPARFPVRTTLEVGVQMRDRMRRGGVGGIEVEVHPADLDQLPGLMTYDIVAYLFPNQRGEDDWHEIPSAALEVFQTFLDTARAGTDTEPRAATESFVVIESGVEASRVESRMAELRALLSPATEGAEWGISLHSHCQLRPIFPPT